MGTFDLGQIEQTGCVPDQYGTRDLCFWQGLCAAMRKRGARPDPTAGLLVLVAAAGLGFGALNEIIEFAATLLVPETNVGGYRNTGWDLVSNLVGATVAVTLIRAKQPETLDEDPDQA